MPAHSPRIIRDPAEIDCASGSIPATLRAYTEVTGTPVLAVWVPDPAISVGPRDRNTPGYQQLREVARSRSYAVIEREMGGRPVVLNQSTLGFVMTAPSSSTHLRTRYQTVQQGIIEALHAVDVSAIPGEPPHSFCPGNHGVQANGKLAGFAQRVSASVTAVGGIVILEAHEEIAQLLAEIYEALDLQFDPESVGSVARAGGQPDGPALQEAIIAALLDRTI